MKYKTLDQESKDIAYEVLIKIHELHPDASCPDDQDVAKLAEKIKDLIIKLA